MLAIVVIVFALWTYPVLSLLFFLLTKKRGRIRRKVITVLCMSTGLTILGMVTPISTTLTAADWILASGIYLSLSMALWWTQFQSSRCLRLLGAAAAVVVFSSGYLAGSIGLLGVSFVVGECAPDAERWLGDGLIYREYNLGNATTDYRGKKVEILRTISWLPVLAWRIREKSYDHLIVYSGNLTVRYAPDRHQIDLSASMAWGPDGHPERWADTIDLIH